MNDHYPPSWVSRLEGLMLIASQTQVDRVFNAWAKAEGGTARFNPLNTTEPMLGATDYNSAGVKNYPTPITGISATAITLALEPYRGLWGALQNPGALTAEQIVTLHASAFDTWGTGAANVLRCL